VSMACLYTTIDIGNTHDGSDSMKSAWTCAVAGGPIIMPDRLSLCFSDHGKG
jgi:hypothetical protein